MSERARTHSNYKAMISEILSGHEYIEEVRAPEALFRPDYVINHNGSTIFLEIEKINPRENVDWKTLQIIEKLFETKLFYGSKVIFKILIYRNDPWKSYCIQLLQNFSDGLIYLDDLNSDLLLRTSLNENNIRLWDLEKEYQTNRSIQGSAYTFEDFSYVDVNEKNGHNQLMSIFRDFNFLIESNYSVKNLKNAYIDRDFHLNLSFYFDFLINDVNIFDFITIKRISIKKLQDMAIRSRLIRYIKDGDMLYSRARPYKMYLIINGKLIGPEYDKNRYVRILHNSGWNLIPFSEVHNYNFLEVIRR
ncbi:hypothetical protein KKF82_07350 [Patescibacteria group bacterium]|nr:hypothetical protein [Patescibacteria group bacterium]